MAADIAGDCGGNMDYIPSIFATVLTPITLCGIRPHDRQLRRWRDRENMERRAQPPASIRYPGRRVAQAAPNRRGEESGRSAGAAGKPPGEIVWRPCRAMEHSHQRPMSQ